jgi:hypothetical protein
LLKKLLLFISSLQFSVEGGKADYEHYGSKHTSCVLFPNITFKFLFVEYWVVHKYAINIKSAVLKQALGVLPVPLSLFLSFFLSLYPIDHYK